MPRSWPCSASGSRSRRAASFDDALAPVQRSTVFTTHTPVPAGHDAFPFSMVEKHLAGCWGEMGVHRERFLALGQHDSGQGSLFNMTALAMRTAENINAVSALHGEVTRTMWRSIWPDTPADQLPVRFITNGVHLPTWMAARLSRSPDPITSARAGSSGRTSASFSDGLLAIPDAELWALREQLRHDLFEYIRERIRSRWATSGSEPNRVVAAGAMLDPHVLTLGYARRFTAYKRPELIFHDPDRLARILNNADRPVQIVFAGKAHPADEPAKLHLQRVFNDASTPRSVVVIAFVDDYDMHVAHYLVQGCDVWLNNPRKPLEASGTSGMKAAMNGVPHLSIGDGWWAEGYNGSNGWLIEATPAPSDIKRRRTPQTPNPSTRCSSRRSCPPSTSATTRACRRGGCRWCASRCAPASLASRPGAC